MFVGNKVKYSLQRRLKSHPIWGSQKPSGLEGIDDLQVQTEGTIKTTPSYIQWAFRLRLHPPLLLRLHPRPPWGSH